MQLGANLGIGMPQQQPQQPGPGASHIRGLQQGIRALLHASQCRDAICQSLSCHKMKLIFDHVRFCDRKTRIGCITCRNLNALSYYHAKDCRGFQCLMPLCSHNKHKLKQKQLRERYVLSISLYRRSHEIEHILFFELYPLVIFFWSIDCDMHSFYVVVWRLHNQALQTLAVVVSLLCRAVWQHKVVW